MKVNINELEEQELFPGFNARFIHSENITIGLVSIAEGSELPGHQHPHEQVSLVRKGSLTITMAGKDYPLGEGEALIIASNMPHSAKAHTDCEVMDFFYPVREDYKA